MGSEDCPLSEQVPYDYALRFRISKLKEEEVTQRVRNHECVHARQWFEVTA